MEGLICPNCCGAVDDKDYLYCGTCREMGCPLDAPCENEENGCKTTCCCGDDMDTHSHPMACGHTPVSMHDWYCEGRCNNG